MEISPKRRKRQQKYRTPIARYRSNTFQKPITKRDYFKNILEIVTPIATILNSILMLLLMLASILLAIASVNISRSLQAAEESMRQPYFVIVSNWSGSPTICVVNVGSEMLQYEIDLTSYFIFDALKDDELLERVFIRVEDMTRRLPAEEDGEVYAFFHVNSWSHGEHPLRNNIPSQIESLIERLMYPRYGYHSSVKDQSVRIDFHIGHAIDITYWDLAREERVESIWYVPRLLAFENCPSDSIMRDSDLAGIRRDVYAHIWTYEAHSASSFNWAFTPTWRSYLDSYAGHTSDWPDDFDNVEFERDILHQYAFFVDLISELRERHKPLP
ncbi:MAG: hypothetical protein FWC81_01310 [Coriobacteriia bacterium]|nr:hypothetical protein [Coriobacteriia bacterium]